MTTVAENAARLALRRLPVPKLLAASVRLAVMATAMALAACGGDSGVRGLDSPSPNFSSLVAHPSAKTDLPGAGGTASVPTADRANLDLEAVATRYLDARENAISRTQRSPRAWLTQIRSVTTRDALNQLSQSLGHSGGFPAAMARTHKWSVRVTVACQHNPDAGPATGALTTLICDLTDRTVDAGGMPVSRRALPSLWPYDGAQPPALLDMRKVNGGGWLVDVDETGRAG